jgi:hypothetical protein
MYYLQLILHYMGLALLGVPVITLGLVQWFGLWRTWYTAPTASQRRFLQLAGPSPMKWIIGGLSFVFEDIAAAYAYPTHQLLLFGLMTLLALGSLFVALALVFWRPSWSIPSWVRRHQH